MKSFSTELTQGNINNNHFYIPRQFLRLFPADSIGGRNRNKRAPREVVIDYGIGRESSDIDGTKRIFRKRGWQRSFIEKLGLVAGDRVTINFLSDYEISVRTQKG